MIRPDCSVDAEACINWIALGIGDFLKNGYTLSLLALSLIALLRVRAREKQKNLDRHTRALLDKHDHRNGKGRGEAWAIKDNRIVEKD